MRAGLSTIQQTLTTEAANVLNQSIADAAARKHGQTTPLHVAAALLASPAGYLRQACARSHPNASHPLQCRPLEVCFSVALERLPTASVVGGEPPINNALMAALKRAQAHQRRGCPENQQQPLLAVKVEIEQLIVSILDDPSVSRVMREARFSSPAIKAVIEQSLAAADAPAARNAGLRLRPTPTPPLAPRNSYVNPRLEPQGGLTAGRKEKEEEVRKVVEVLLRGKNPVIVGDGEPGAVAREVVRMIESNGMGEAALRDLRVVSLEREVGSDRAQILAKMKVLEGLIDDGMDDAGGVILDLGNLKWMVEQPASRFAVGPIQQQQQQVVSEFGRAVVAKMKELLAKYAGGDEAETSRRLWAMGTASCETYLRCQVYHPSMENDWDLQAVPIAARAPMAAVFPRIGGNNMIGSALAAGAAAIRRPPEPKLCPSCTDDYDKEMAELGVKPEPRSILPQWMQTAKLGSEKSLEGKEQELLSGKKMAEELHNKWSDNCRLLHPSFHSSSDAGQPTSVNPIITGGVLLSKVPDPSPMPHSLINPKLQLAPMPHSLINPKLQLAPRNHFLLSCNPPAPSRQSPSSPPASPVRTDLVLGRPKSSPEKDGGDDWRGLADIATVHQNLVKEAATTDADSFKSLSKGLAERVAWQADAASIVATTVIQSKSGNPKRRGGQAKGDTWMLFLGPDRVGKMGMAAALSDLLYRPPPVTIPLAKRSLRHRRNGAAANNDGGESDFRGKTVVDRLAEAVRRNPLSIVVLEDVDQVDMMVYSVLRRAMGRGRVVDSHGREVSLGSTIFIFTADWLPENSIKSFKPTSPRSAKIAAMASGEYNWELQFATVNKTIKRCADWSPDENDNRSSRSRKDSGSSIGLDLNMVAASEETSTSESTSASPPPKDLPDIVDKTVIFRPVDFEPLRTKVAAALSAKLSDLGGEGGAAAMEVDDDALDRIVGGVWFGRTGFEEWATRVLVPSFRRLRPEPDAGLESGSKIVRLIASVRGPLWEGDGGDDWLPSLVSFNSVCSDLFV